MSVTGDMWKTFGEICCRAVPEHFPVPARVLIATRALMKHARHFELPRCLREENRSATQASLDLMAEMWDEFQFPFDVVAVSDRDNPITPTVTVVGRYGDAPGLHQGIQVAAMSPLPTKEHDYIMTMLSCRFTGPPDMNTRKLNFLMDEGWSIMASKDGKRVHSTQDRVVDGEKLDHKEATRRFVAEALLEVVELMALVQGPKHFIVERPPLIRKPRKKKSRVGIPNLSERPVYIGMTSPEIRREFGLPTGRRVADHDVRAHYRVLRHERYKENRGKRVFVKAHFAGPAAGTGPDGRRYKVRLDIATPFTQ